MVVIVCKRVGYFIALISMSFLAAFAAVAAEVVIKHDGGQTTLTTTPQRVVVLGYSFVDALAVAGVSPIGIADEGDKSRVIARVRAKIGDWQSVGSRYQPSLEAISSLKPDLIIADTGRHQSIYQDLSRIAPTLLLKNRGVSYQENIAVMRVIARALNKTEQVSARLQRHHALIKSLKAQIKSEASVQFAILTDKGMWLHSPKSYAGSVLKALGLASPIAGSPKQSYLQTSFEQLLKTNPDWLLVGKYSEVTVLDKWQTSPLWRMLSVAKTKQLVTVSPMLWSLATGMLAAEQMAEEITQLLKE